MDTPDCGGWKPPPIDLYLDTDSAHLWILELNHPESLGPSDWALLSNQERERAARFHFERDRHRYISIHLTLRKLLSRYLDVDPSLIQFRTSEKGKPHLDPAIHPTKLYFNLSHSADLAVYAFTLGIEIGVDVEAVRPIDDLKSIARSTFSPGEYDKLNTLPPNQELYAFFNCWTRKEALIKALGEGLSLPLDHFEVSLGEPARLLSYSSDLLLDGSWTLVSLQPIFGYVGAIAIHANKFRLECYLF